MEEHQGPINPAQPCLLRHAFLPCSAWRRLGVWDPSTAKGKVGAQEKLNRTIRYCNERSKAQHIFSPSFQRLVLLAPLSSTCFLNKALLLRKYLWVSRSVRVFVARTRLILEIRPM